VCAVSVFLSRAVSCLLGSFHLCPSTCCLKLFAAFVFAPFPPCPSRVLWCPPPAFMGLIEICSICLPCFTLHAAAHARVPGVFVISDFALDVGSVAIRARAFSVSNQPALGRSRSSVRVWLESTRVGFLPRGEAVILWEVCAVPYGCCFFWSFARVESMACVFVGLFFWFFLCLCFWAAV